MTRLTPEQGTALQKFPQRSNIYLFVQSGEFVWTGTITAITPTADCTRITVTNLSGDKTKLVPHMTAWVGSALDPKAKGNIRIVHGNYGGTQYILLAPNSLGLALGDQVSVDRIFRLYAINNHHDVDNSDPVGALPWYPYGCMGPNRAAWTGEPISFYGSQSWGQHGATITSHTWGAEGSAVVMNPDRLLSGGSPDNPILIYWTEPGDYMLTHLVTDSTGKQHLSYRVVLVRDRPGHGAFPPITEFTVSGCRGSYNDGGWQAGIKVHSPADQGDFPDNAVVILYAEDFYGPEGNRTYMPVGNKRWENILLAGNIRGSKTTSEGDVVGGVEFDVVTLDNYMKDLTIWPNNFGPTAASAPNAWHRYAGWSILDIIYHQLVQHSTFSIMADFIQWDLHRRIDFIDLTEASLWDQLDSQLGSTRAAHPVLNRYNQLWMQKDANLRTATERTSLGSREYRLSKYWWTQIDIGEELARERTAQIDFIGSAIGTHPTVDTFTINYSVGAAAGNVGEVYSLYPAVQYSYGSIEKLTDMWVLTQAEADSLALSHLAKSNNRFPLITISTWNLRAWDIAEQSYIGVDLELGDTSRGWVWVDKEFIVRDVEYNIDPSLGYISVNYGLEDSIWGPDGTAGFYAPGATGPDIDVPPTAPPIEQRRGADILMCWKYGILHCNDVYAAIPSWSDVTGDLASRLNREANTSPRINGVCRDIYDPESTWWAWGHFGIAKTVNAGINWTLVYNLNTMAFYMPSLTTEQKSTFCVIRFQQSLQPSGYAAALVATKYPSSTTYSQLTLTHTHDNWLTCDAHVPVSNGVRFTDHGNYSSPLVADLQIHQYPNRQPQGYHTLWVSTCRGDWDTVNLWRSLDGGHTLTRMVWAASTGYNQRWPGKIVIPYTSNDDALVAWWVEDGTKGNKALYKITNATAGSPTYTLQSETTARYGVGFDPSLCIFPYATDRFRSAGNGGNGAFYWSGNAGVNWEQRASPPGPFQGFAQWPYLPEKMYIGHYGFNGQAGMFFITTDEGRNWQDKSANLYQLMTIGGVNTNAEGVWSVIPNWKE